MPSPVQILEAVVLSSNLFGKGGRGGDDAAASDGKFMVWAVPLSLRILETAVLSSILWRGEGEMWVGAR